MSSFMNYHVLMIHKILKYSSDDREYLGGSCLYIKKILCALMHQGFFLK